MQGLLNNQDGTSSDVPYRDPSHAGKQVGLLSTWEQPPVIKQELQPVAGQPGLIHPVAVPKQKCSGHKQGSLAAMHQQGKHQGLASFIPSAWEATTALGAPTSTQVEPPQELKVQVCSQGKGKGVGKLSAIGSLA